MFEMRPYDNRRNHLGYYNPFKDLENFEKDFFTNGFDIFSGNPAGFKTDIKDTGDAYVLEADMPGFDKKDIHLDINGNYLTVSAERRSECEQRDKDHNYVRRERSYGSYSRSFDISSVDTDGIKAKYENGVITLTMPKKPEITGGTKRLEIE